MELVWGIFLTVLTLIAWIGQFIYAISPSLGAKIGVGEAEVNVHPVFYIDARGEAIWDGMIIWTLPIAGVLLIFNNPYWAYFGLVGGGIYLYFTGRNITTRLMMRRNNIAIGTEKNIKLGNLFILLWGLAAIITILMALNVLLNPVF